LKENVHREDVTLRRWLDSFVHPLPLSKLTATYRSLNNNLIFIMYILILLSKPFNILIVLSFEKFLDYKIIPNISNCIWNIDGAEKSKISRNDVADVCSTADAI